MHASHVKKKKKNKPNFKSFLLNLEIFNFVTNKNFSKKIRYAFNENIDQFCVRKIISVFND